MLKEVFVRVINQFQMSGERIMVEEIERRRSSRVFDSDYEIDNATVRDIIAAASKAPSKKNKQPWRYFAVKGTEKRKFVDYLMELLDNPPERTQYEIVDKKICRRCIRILNECSAIAMVFLVNDFMSSKGKNNINVTYKRGTTEKSDIESIVAEKEAGYEKIFDYLSIGMSVQNLLLEATRNDIDTLCLGFGSYFFPEIMEYFKQSNEFVMMIAMGKSIEPYYRTPRKNLDDVLTIME